MTNLFVAPTPVRAHGATADERALSATSRRLLRWWNAFRIIIALMLIALACGPAETITFGAARPRLFLVVAVLYLAFGCLLGLALRRRRPSITGITYGQLAVDIAAVVLWLDASTGDVTEFGSLLFVPIAIASLLLSRRMAFGAAAMATLALFAQQSLAVLQAATSVYYTQTAVLGIVFFTTALVCRYLARRLEESETLAEQRRFDLANLAQLNDCIIQHMRTGVLAVDAEGGIRLMNNAAAHQLGVARAARDQQRLAALCAPLERALERWRREERLSQPVYAPSGAALVPHFTELDREQNATLVFLEDPSLMSEEVRQMKLAALGRLTAGIAHEIRNPLAAVSHANQLLAEASTLGEEEKRMSAIIGEHTERVNRIVENVLRLSRRGSAHLEQLDLNAWLRGFAAEFIRCQGLPETSLALVLEKTTGALAARVDRSHLHQVVWNLAENALRYAAPESGAETKPAMEFASGRSLEALPWIEVRDRGPGIVERLADTIFEPFYTSSARGTGLGLFIARELCECNRATLIYAPRAGGGSCFRIIFGDPRSWAL